MDGIGPTRWVLMFVAQFSLLRGLGVMLQVPIGATSSPPLTLCPCSSSPPISPSSLYGISVGSPLHPPAISKSIPPPVPHLSAHHSASSSCPPQNFDFLSFFSCFFGLYHGPKSYSWFYLVCKSLSLHSSFCYPSLLPLIPTWATPPFQAVNSHSSTYCTSLNFTYISPDPIPIHSSHLPRN